MYIKNKEVFEMHLFCVLMLTLCCFLTISGAQHFIYADQRKSGNSYSQPSASSSSYRVPSPSRNLYPYSGSATQLSNKNPSNKAATWNYKSASSKGNYRSSIPAINLYVNKQYSSGPFNTNNFKRDSSSQLSSLNKNIRKSISKADAENSKFAGAENQENEDARTLHFKHKKFHRGFNGALINPCSFYGRDSSKSITPPPKEQSRFLWDVHVHNYYPQNSLGLGCGGYGSFGSVLGAGGLGAGLLSDPVGPSYYSPGSGIANFLNYFAPGILQNSLAVTARPQQFADFNQPINENVLQNDPEVDPNYRPGPAAVPVRRPNQVFYDSAGAPSVTPGQLVGGISTTVNGIIQQLTGNVQPVYG